MSRLSTLEPAPASVSRALLHRQPRGFLLTLAGIVLLHLVLCVWFHWDRAFLGDEWGSIDALKQPYTQLVTHFGDWRTMNFYLCALKFLHERFGATNWMLVAPGILCGSWLVALVAATALRLGGGTRTALVCALLAAVNPWLVAYAITIRSYIFLAAFGAAMFLSLLDWRALGRWRDGICCGMMGAAAMLMHLNAVYTFAAIGTLAIGSTINRLRSHEHHALARLVRLALPACVLVGLAAAAHIPMLPDIVRFRAQWSSATPVSPAFVPRVAERFFGADWLMLPALLGTLYGGWRIVRDRCEARLLIVMILVPVAAVSLAGVSHYPNAYARFLIAILPMLLLLIGHGIGVGSKGRLTSLTAGMLLVLVASTSAAALLQARQRAAALPFHRFSAAVAQGPAARSVLLGPDVHAMGLRMSGVRLDPSIAESLAAGSASSPMILNVVDLADLTAGMGGVNIGSGKVVQLVGTPRQVADRLAALWRARLDNPGSSDGPAMARELAALLRWQGDHAASARYEQIGRQPLAPDARVR